MRIFCFVSPVGDLLSILSDVLVWPSRESQERLGDIFHVMIDVQTLLRLLVTRVC